MMPTEPVRYELTQPAAWQLLDGSTVEVTTTSVAVDDDVVLAAEVDLATWEHIHAAAAFHSDGEPAPAGFDADRPVRLTLRLHAGLAARFADTDTLVTDLVAEAPSPLRHSEAWYLLEAVQHLDVPGEPGAWTQHGIRTRFAD